MLDKKQMTWISISKYFPTLERLRFVKSTRHIPFVGGTWDGQSANGAEYGWFRMEAFVRFAARTVTTLIWNRRSPCQFSAHVFNSHTELKQFARRGSWGIHQDRVLPTASRVDLPLQQETARKDGKDHTKRNSRRIE
jgi:hypothetical protein